MIPILASMLFASAPIPPEIEDEQTLGINTVPHHSVLMPFGSLAEALRADRSKSIYARSLNGPWRFHWVKRPEERPADFYRTDFDDSQWKTIPVPSCWQVLGYGTPYYRNAGYIFQKDWPRVMSEPPKDWTAYDERNPVGSYRRTFTVPAGWNGREVFLKFDGVDAGFFLWVNGQKVGYSQNSRNAAEFDVTKYLKPGANQVAVEVYRFTAGSYFEDQDMWRLSGIFRNVTLWSAPKLHVQDTFVTTDLDGDYRDATLKVVAKVHNYGENPSTPQECRVELYDPSGKRVLGAASKDLVGIPSGGEKVVTLEFPVKTPLKWTAETPTLYTAVVTLHKPDGMPPVETLSHRVGFRKVEIKGRVFMVNGKPVKLKGANRHEMSPETGHTVTEADMIQDLVMLKKANCNHVRTCHYSDDPRWYELCDEWGIYLVAEANAESHGYYGQIDREPRFERMVVDRNLANVENFKNHPSVVIWSLGNECGGGSNFHAANEAVMALDKSRPTHYEPFGDGAGNPAGIDSHMYTDPAGTERIAQRTDLTKPFYLCEYAHAMNNSMGSIGEYNDLFDKYPALMGGAIWEWEDQGLWNRRDPKRPYLAYGGGFGEKPNDGYFIHKGVVFSDRSPKPHFPEAKRAYQWVGFRHEGGHRVTIRNKFAFTDLSKYTLRWRLVSDAGTMMTGEMPMPSIPPGAERSVTVPAPMVKLPAGTSVYLDVAAILKAPEKWAPKGYEIANGQFALADSRPATTAAPKGALNVETTGGNVRIVGQGFALNFDRATGTLSEMSKGGKNLLLPGGGPKPHLWRAQHRNDDGWAAGGWRAAGLMDLKPEILDLRVDKNADNVAVVSSSVRYVGRNGFSVLHLAKYTVYADGRVAVDNALSPSNPNLTLARMGVRMLLDPALDNLDYFARGPMENYADRKRGSDLGRYASTVAAQMTPYPKPQECGNHEDLKWLTLGAKDGRSLWVVADQAPLQFSALPYRDEDMEDVPYRVDLPKRNATVLIVSGRTLGVGSAACGPRPLPEYRLDGTPRAFSYVLTLGTGVSAGVPARAGGPVLVTRAPNGQTSLTGSAPIQVSDDGKAWTAYAGPFTVAEASRKWVRSGGFTGVVAVQPPPAKAAWKATASSYERGEGEPQNALDGDESTFWHTRWSGDAAKPPHSLTVDLGKVQTVGRVILTQRRENHNGRIREYEVYVSEDGQNWGTAVAKGQLPDRDAPTTVRLDAPHPARYVKLVVLSDRSDGGWAALAEFDAGP